MLVLRSRHEDKKKSPAVRKAQQSAGLTCKLVDCNEPLSIYTGPGSDCLCRKHQLECVEYGTGMGKPERPHTFYRGWVCEECNYDPREDAQIQSIEDEFHKLRVMRGVMHGDHQVRKSDGGSDAADNIRTLCCRCHMIKTYKEKDYLAGKVLLDS